MGLSYYLPSFYSTSDTSFRSSFDLLPEILFSGAKSSDFFNNHYIPILETIIEPELQAQETFYLPPKQTRSCSHKDGYWGLVCIETNPGPKTQAQKVLQKSSKQTRSGPSKGQSRSNRGNNRSVGRRIGSTIGGFIGDFAQKAIQGITGMGDYTVSNNTLFNGSISSNGPPQFLSRGGAGSSRFMHREFVSDVFGSTTFKLTSYIINPLQSTLFPWFSLIATQYEQWKLHGLVFEFKTTSGTAVSSTNTALGTVIMATQYNIMDTPFTSKLQMEQYQYCVSTVPFISAIHPVECKPSMGTLDTLYCVPGSNGDARFSDFGVFSIATVGMQAVADIGELWVSFDIELIKPRLFTNSVTPSNPLFTSGSYIQQTQSKFVSNDLFGYSPWIPTKSSTFEVTLGSATNGTGNLVSIPGNISGTYMVVFNVSVTVSGASPTTLWSSQITSGSDNYIGTLGPTVSYSYSLPSVTGGTYQNIAELTTSMAGESANLSFITCLTFAGSSNDEQTFQFSWINIVASGNDSTGQVVYAAGNLLMVPFEL